MKYDVYLVISPTEPERACVSAHPPTPERRRALEAEGCEIFNAKVEVPTKFEREFTTLHASAVPCSYCGRRVRSAIGHDQYVTGVVKPSKLTNCIEVEWGKIPGWDHAETGTFFLDAFEERLASGALTWEDEPHAPK